MDSCLAENTVRRGPLPVGGAMLEGRWATRPCDWSRAKGLSPPRCAERGGGKLLRHSGIAGCRVAHLLAASLRRRGTDLVRTVFSARRSPEWIPAARSHLQGGTGLVALPHCQPGCSSEVGPRAGLAFAAELQHDLDPEHDDGRWSRRRRRRRSARSTPSARASTSSPRRRRARSRARRRSSPTTRRRSFTPGG